MLDMLDFREGFSLCSRLLDSYSLFFTHYEFWFRNDKGKVYLLKTKCFVYCKSIKAGEQSFMNSSRPTAK